MNENIADQNMRLWLLKSLAANYPVLKAQGKRVTKALLVSSDEGQAEEIYEILKVFSGTRIDSYTDQAKLRRVFTEANSEFICFVYAPSERNKNFLNELLTIARTGSYDGLPLNALVCVIAEGFPFGINSSEAYFVPLEGKIEKIVIPQEMFVPDEEKISLAKDMIREEKNESDSRTFFHDAAGFIYPCLEDKQKDAVYAKLLKVADEMSEQMNDCDGTADICEYFKNTLRRWQKKKRFSDVFELPRIGSYAEKHIDEVFLFDETRIFLSEKLFRSIVEPLRKVVPWGVLVNALAENEILLAEHRDALSIVVPSKVGYYTEDGNLQRKRMIRLNREKLHEAGERELIKSCLDERRKHV